MNKKKEEKILLLTAKMMDASVMCKCEEMMMKEGGREGGRDIDSGREIRRKGEGGRERENEREGRNPDRERSLHQCR